jgi:hypothetical protein
MPGCRSPASRASLREDGVAARAAEPDAHPARQTLLRGSGDAPSAVHLGPDRRSGFEQRLACRRQPDPPGRPLEQIDVEVSLERADHLAERGLRDVQTLRSPPEMQLLGNGEERCDLPELHAVIPVARIDKNLCLINMILPLGL